MGGLLSTRVHGYLDYLMGFLLIVAPWLFGFVRGGAETWVPVVVGMGAIVYSVMTNYELGVVRIIAMPTHLWLDIFGGAVLVVSPWLFEFAANVDAPHVILGLVEIGAALVTSRVPAGEPVRA